MLLFSLFFLTKPAFLKSTFFIDLQEQVLVMKITVSSDDVTMGWNVRPNLNAVLRAFNMSSVGIVYANLAHEHRC